MYHRSSSGTYSSIVLLYITVQVDQIIFLPLLDQFKQTVQQQQQQPQQQHAPQTSIATIITRCSQIFGLLHINI